VYYEGGYLPFVNCEIRVRSRLPYLFNKFQVIQVLTILLDCGMMYGMNEIIINRTWAMPNKWTFKVKPIYELIIRYATDGVGWADPFAGQSNIAEYRNDLNPEHNQPYSMEAVEFMESLDVPLQGVIFDPPYSLTQVSRSYKDFGLNFKSKENPTGGFPKVKDEISRLVVVGGYVISFGWNTVGMGKGRGFDIVEILIVSHGGNRNDTLCTVEKKP